ncbi:condensation domain-containing protein, partial [Nonomuraea sp. NPDC047897]|uniref:condensation domain-containing protein n=1 Tax=Nonomuraea sp. NPDC047897 TaxID=3364346 RepID=UPI00371274E8
MWETATFHDELERTVTELTGGPCRAVRPVHGHGLTLLVEAGADAWPADRVRGAVIDAHREVVETVVHVRPGSLAGRCEAELLTAYRRGGLEVVHTDELTPAALPATPAVSAVSAASAAPAMPAASAASGASAFTLDEVRQAAAALVGLPAGELDPDDDLIRHGVDSIRIMQLANDWQRQGIRVKFADLAETPTVAAWHALLSSRAATPAPGSGPLPEVDRAAPFALTPVQHAYWFGRRDGQVLGGVGCHFYVEFDGRGVDAAALENAVRALFDRHELLRTRFTDDGAQRILPRSPWPGLTVHDLRDRPAQEVAECLAGLRERLSHRRLDVGRAEVLDLTLSLLPDGAHRLHVNIDLLVADVRSIQILLDDLAALYAAPGEPLPPIGCTFPAYLAERERRLKDEREADRRYWAERLPDLPGGPRLPLAVEPERLDRVRVVRRDLRLDPERRSRLAERARAHGVTLPMALATALAEVIGAWSDSPRFLLNMPLFDRRTLNPDVPRMVADFTNLLLLEVDLTEPASFAGRAAALQRRFQADAAHSAYSGVEVLRDLNRGGRADQVTAPVVFTSAFGMGDLVGAEVQRHLGRLGWMLSQTPQVWLDHQVVEVDGGLLFNWDAVEELFAPGVLDGMAGAFARLLDWMVEHDWDAAPPDLLPAGQFAVRAAANDTAGVLPAGTLHGGFFAVAGREPGRVALVSGGVRVSYGELAGRALRVAGFLRGRGVGVGDAV